MKRSIFRRPAFGVAAVMAAASLTLAGCTAADDGSTGTSETSAEAEADQTVTIEDNEGCLLYTSPSPRDRQKSRMPSSA